MEKQMHLEHIETERLQLIVVSSDEMDYIFENYSRDQIKKILGHATDEEYEKEAYKYQNGYSSYNRKFKLFLMRDKATQVIFGRCGLHNWNIDHNRSEVGYAIHDETYKNKGYMTETLRAVLDYGFLTLKLNRIEAMVAAWNVASLRLLQQNNFTQEGVLRGHYFWQNSYQDSLVFSKLLEEHSKGVANQSSN